MGTRSIVIAGCGLLLGLISVMVIGLTIRSLTPHTLSLAYRIDTDRTVFFIRTTDLTSFARAITVYAPMMTAPPSQLAELPRGVSYEFALLSGTGNDQPAVSNIEPLQWMIDIHTGNQRHTTFVAADDPGLLLDVRDIGRSLGRSSAFLESERNAANLTFIDVSRLPFAGGSIASLARSIVAPFQSAVVTWDGLRGQLNLRKKEKTIVASNGPLRGQLNLRKKEKTIVASNGPMSDLLPQSSDALLSVASSDPQAIFRAFARSFEAQDTPLYEGLKGILSKELEAITHHTDLTSAMADLASKPTRLLITGKEKEKDGFRFVVTGQAINRKVADQWVEDLRSATVPARVRSQLFFNENSRVDVIADPSAYEKRTMSGWTMTTIGSGSSRPFTVAGKGDQIILGNDSDLLLSALHHLDQKAMLGRGPRSLVGTADIAWLIKAAGEWLPFLSSDLSILTSTLFGTDVSRVDWTMTDGASAVVIHFMLLYNPAHEEWQEGRQEGKKAIGQ